MSVSDKSLDSVYYLSILVLIFVKSFFYILSFSLFTGSVINLFTSIVTFTDTATTNTKNTPIKIKMSPSISFLKSLWLKSLLKYEFELSDPIKKIIEEVSLSFNVEF
jgi:hypothetical protein